MIALVVIVAGLLADWIYSGFKCTVCHRIRALCSARAYRKGEE